MNCPRCGKPVPPGSSFCMHCGQMFAPAAQPAAPGAVAVPAKSNRGVWIGVGATLVAVAAAFLGLAAAGVLQFNQKPPPTESLSTQAPPSTPTLAQQKPPDIKMPDDIYAWLEHLRKIEARREQMSLEQQGRLQALMLQLYGAQLKSLMDEEAQTPPAMAAEEMEKTRATWAQLLTDFRSFPPPAECKPIANDYDDALSETKGMMSDLLGALAAAPQDEEAARSLVGNLTKLKGQSSVIDKSALNADKGVQGICDKYNTRKWFQIKGDYGGGGMLSLPAGAGMPDLGNLGGLGG